MLLFVLLLLDSNSMTIFPPFYTATEYQQQELFHLVGQFSEQLILDLYCKELCFPQMATDQVLLIFSISNLAQINLMRLNNVLSDLSDTW